MGGPCSLHLDATDPDAAEQVAKRVIGEIERIERRYSRYLPQSLLSRLNAAARNRQSIAVDPETAGLLDHAFACHRLSGGLFDITSGVLRRAWSFRSGQLPRRAALKALLDKVGMDKLLWEEPTLHFAVPGMELDFGGIAKEYAVDRAVDFCRHSGIRYGVVELGGDIGIIGPHADGSPWQVGIRHHRRPDKRIAAIALAGGALAVSGDYERCIERDGRRLSHILDPRTGWPCQGLSSVAVAAERCMAAGSLSTIAMLKGQDGSAWLGGLAVPCLSTGDGDRPEMNAAWRQLLGRQCAAGLALPPTTQKA